jgi:8-oxo-dGTP pyrophosphatase MutT (NUDIX family)
MTDEGSPPAPETTTGYGLPALTDGYGARPLRTETFDVGPQKYDEVRAEQRNGELGGARVLVRHPDRRATFLVSNRGEHGWDIPGGAREAGEAPEETAVRECYEETGLRVELRDLLRVYEFSFVLDATEPPVAGLWLHFDGVPVGAPSSVTLEEDELDDGGWLAEPPAELDRYAGPAVKNYLSSGE